MKSTYNNLKRYFDMCVRKLVRLEQHDAELKEEIAFVEKLILIRKTLDEIKNCINIELESVSEKDTFNKTFLLSTVDSVFEKLQKELK